MKIRNNQQTTFKASISNELIAELNNINTKTKYRNRNVLRKQIRRVASWGKPETLLFFNKKDRELTATNVLVNSKQRTVIIGKNILKDFLELTEDKLKSIEQKLKPLRSRKKS